jgi:hypothetical protein
MCSEHEFIDGRMQIVYSDSDVRVNVTCSICEKVSRLNIIKYIYFEKLN